MWVCTSDRVGRRAMAMTSCGISSLMSNIWSPLWAIWCDLCKYEYVLHWHVSLFATFCSHMLDCKTTNTKKTMPNLLSSNLARWLPIRLPPSFAVPLTHILSPNAALHQCHWLLKPNARWTHSQKNNCQEDTVILWERYEALPSQQLARRQNDGWKTTFLLGWHVFKR